MLLREEDLGKADPAMTLGQPVKAIVHVRVVDADPSQADRPYWALRPLVIPRWVNALHVTYPDSEVRVTGTPLVVDSLVDAEHGLLETLDHTPVLAVIPDHPAFPHQGNDRDPRPLFDPDRMAFRFEPLARVITVTRDTSEQLVRSFPPDQSWFEGAVLLFLRSGTPGALAEAKAAGNQSDAAPGPRGFRRFLQGLLGRWGRRGGSRGQSVGVDAVHRGARASTIGASDLAAVRESLYQDLARQLTEAALARTPTEFAELREDIRVWQELEQSDAVVSDQRRIRDLVDQVQEYRTLYEEASAELARLRRPARYTEVAAWCVREFRGQLVLAGKAERSLRDSHYEDLPLVLRLLELLATEYRDWRRGDLEARHRLSDALAAEGVELSKCLTPQQSGRVPRGEYRIRYEGRPFDLDWHLKKGADRDPRHCMRIYFAWDDYSHRVVVGHLTGHLQTASS